MTIQNNDNMDKETRQRIANLSYEGLETDEIAKRLGLPESQVFNILQEEGEI